MAVMQLGYIGLSVSDIPKWTNYATSVLGMAVCDSEENLCYLRMDEYHHRIVLHGNGDDDLAYLGWQVSTPRALAEVADNVRAADVAVFHGDKENAAIRRVVDFIWFEDLNGLRHEIFVGPVISSENLFLPGRPMSGFRTVDLGLGHVVVWAKGPLEHSIHFYREVMGFSVSDYIDLSVEYQGLGDAVFLRCNHRHHSLAVLENPSQLGRKTIDHFMVETNSIDDVGSAYDILEGEGVPLASTLGRHTNDQMLSFYMISPSGFAVEYGWGGRLIDEDRKSVV